MNELSLYIISCCADMFSTDRGCSLSWRFCSRAVNDVRTSLPLCNLEGALGPYRSVSSPHINAMALQLQQQQQQSGLGARLAAAQHASHGSLSSFALPQSRRHGLAAGGGVGGMLYGTGSAGLAADASALPRGSSYSDMASAAAVTVAGGLADRFSASQQFGDGGGGGGSADPQAFDPLQAASLRGSGFSNENAPPGALQNQ